MKQNFHKVRSATKLTREHVIDLLETLLGRKRMMSSLSQSMKDFFYGVVPCKRFLSKKNIERRHIYEQAQILLNRSFDVKNLLRNTNLIKIMLGTMFTREQSLLFLFQRK